MNKNEKTEKNDNNKLKSSLSSNTGSVFLNENYTKILSSQKESQTAQNKNITPKNKSISSNHIFVPIEEDKKSKYSKNSKKGKEKSDSKKKKKNQEKIAKILKNNERIKIPMSKKRRSFAVDKNNLKLNLNNFNNILKSLTPPKPINIRTDKNGVEINKANKKLVHITFLDDISPNNKITETVVIQSFKKFNIFKDSPTELNVSNCSKCCLIY